MTARMTARLHATVTGPDGAPVVVLGSSLGTTREMWAPQLASLAERFRVIAFDHRGHGQSQVPAGPYRIDDLGQDVLRLLDRLSVGRFCYAGLSLGGMVGMWLAAAVPERVERLALLCTSACLGPDNAYRERAAVVRRAGMAEVADAVIARWFTPEFGTASPDVVARYRAMLLATPAAGYAGCCEAIADMDLRSRLGDVRAPTLVVCGDRDTATPPAAGRDIAARIAGARLLIVPHAAHLANVEQPGIVNAQLAGHLAGEFLEGD